MTSKLTSIADEKIEDVIKMARESAKIYGGEWDSALIAESPGNNVHGITSDHIEAVVVKNADDSLHSSWLCDYLESVSPAFVIAALTELQERRKADSEPVAWRRFQETPTDGGYWILYDNKPNCSGVEPLYRHAQPVLEIESEPVFTLEVARADYKGQKLGNHFGFITLDAARELKEGNYQLYTAQPAPVVPDDVLDALQKVARIRLDMDVFDGDRRGIADCLCDAEEALIEVVNRRAAMLAAAPQEVPDEK